MTTTSIQKRLARNVSDIFKDEVLNNSKFTFKNILVNDGLGCTCGGFDGRVEGWENMWGKNLCNCKREIMTDQEEPSFPKITTKII